MGSAWQLYDELIEGVDAGERVLGMCEGSHWTCVEASCGTGVAATCKGGRRERLSPLAGKPLRDVAASRDPSQDHRTLAHLTRVPAGVWLASWFLVDAVATGVVVLALRDLL